MYPISQVHETGRDFFNISLMGQFLIASSEYFGLYDAVQKYSHYPESDSDSSCWHPLSPSQESDSESISASVAKSQCYIHTFVCSS